VHPGASTVKITDDVSHTGLVAEEGGEVRGLGDIVPGEGLDLSPGAA